MVLQPLTQLNYFWKLQSDRRFEDLPFISAINFEKIELENVKAERYNKLIVETKSEGEIEFVNSGDFIVEKLGWKAEKKDD